MSSIGHNQGPSMEGGASWRRHCWSKARRDLLPQLPLEVIRVRVRRAKELGLPYKTYATVRASSGCDIVAFLFSSNALRLLKQTDTLPADRAAKLVEIRDCKKLLAVTAPLSAAELSAQIAARQNITFDNAFAAPGFTTSWRDTRQMLLKALKEHSLAADTVMLVGDTALERDWLTAGWMAGYLNANTYFPTPAPA